MEHTQHEKEQVDKMMQDVSLIAEEIDVDHIKIMAITWNMQG